MSSSLVSYIHNSPNNSGYRTLPITRITPHCVVGQCSVETLGNIFAPVSKQASCNYGIGVDGRVGLYVPEEMCSWCSSSNANDQQSVTIECASDMTAPYAFNDVVYNRLIELCVDICIRNKKNKLIWFGDKNKTLSYKPSSNEMILTVHRWFANKSCPGDWMYNRMSDLAEKVTAKLNNVEPAPIKDGEEIYRVQLGAFKSLENAENYLRKVHEEGYNAFIVKIGELYKIQVGAFKIKKNAETYLACVKESGFNAFITSSGSGYSFSPYKVKVTADVLNVRKSNSSTSRIVGKLKRNEVYTIVDEKQGLGASLWGELKSGLGWISLDYAEKI